jgi:hydroxyacylglutathione hydrolase
MPDITAIAAFKDNYIWCLRQAKLALIVDPGDASAVMRYLEQQQLELDVILITHHHPDHTGGIAELKQQWPDVMVYAPAAEQHKIAYADQWLEDNDQVELAQFNLTFQVMQLPGHTLGHIAYYSAPVLFCGDTLFNAGCGRLFEGTAEQMWQSLSRILTLPDNTLVYATHEYTLANLEFARWADPDNTELAHYQHWCQQQRELEQPTLPTPLAVQRQINPFLRADDVDLQRRWQQHNAVSLFTALRSAKDRF